MELLFASQNKNKVLEIQSSLEGSYLIKSLDDVGCEKELDEPHDTFEANAIAKAKQGFEIFGLPCFAEDAGLVIAALDGKPGVFSARYAGPEKDVEANIDKVLHEMHLLNDRSAYFIAVIAYYTGAQMMLFEGRVDGTILREREGTGGFGYDPIFKPTGYDQSFGSLSLTVKKTMSHRAIAIKKFITYLNAQGR